MCKLQKIRIVGTETAKVIGEAVKKFKFRGADISPIEIGVKNKLFHQQYLLI